MDLLVSQGYGSPWEIGARMTFEQFFLYLETTRKRLDENKLFELKTRGFSL